MRLENNMIIYEPPKAPNKIPLIDISDFYSSDLEKQKSIAYAELITVYGVLALSLQHGLAIDE